MKLLSFWPRALKKGSGWLELSKCWLSPKHSPNVTVGILCCCYRNKDISILSNHFQANRYTMPRMDTKVILAYSLTGARQPSLLTGFIIHHKCISWVCRILSSHAQLTDVTDVWDFLHIITCVTKRMFLSFVSIKEQEQPQCCQGGRCRVPMRPASSHPSAIRSFVTNCSLGVYPNHSKLNIHTYLGT